MVNELTVSGLVTIRMIASHKKTFVISVLALGFLLFLLPAGAMNKKWIKEWPNTDFGTHSVDLDEIISGGVPKDAIRSIDAPFFIPVNEMHSLSASEPVIGFELNGDARAYPLRVLTRHEIVNDVVDGMAVTVTYCPLCNAAIVFNRRVGDEVLEFGTTGKLRNSDLVMYDRSTESWWQQFTGEAIVGEYTGTSLEMLPARLESWERFVTRFPDGTVLSPRGVALSSYGHNPYAGYDTADIPFLYRGKLPKNIPAMARVVAVGPEAWSLELLSQKGTIETDDYVISWTAGQNSALDTADIRKGRDVGNVIVQRKTESGLVDAIHDVTFAFVFQAFHPEGIWHLE